MGFGLSDLVVLGFMKTFQTSDITIVKSERSSKLDRAYSKSNCIQLCVDIEQAKYTRNESLINPSRRIK